MSRKSFLPNVVFQNEKNSVTGVAAIGRLYFRIFMIVGIQQIFLKHLKSFEPPSFFTLKNLFDKISFLTHIHCCFQTR